MKWMKILFLEKSKHAFKIKLLKADQASRVYHKSKNCNHKHNPEVYLGLPKNI